MSNSNVQAHQIQRETQISKQSPPEHTEQVAPERGRAISTLGTLARLAVGGWLLIDVAAAFRLDEWYEPVLGLLVFPAILMLGQWLRLRYTSTPLRATGSVGHLVNVAIFLALYLTPRYFPPLAFTSDAALYFYGASMLLAAVRGYAGCEVLAVSNWLLRRDDQVGCVLFWPVDTLEAQLTGEKQMATGKVPAGYQSGRASLAERIPISHEAMSLGAWLLTILAAELAIHGVGEAFRGVLPQFLALTVVIALLTGQRYRRTGLPHWLLASFAATLVSLNGFLYAYADLGVTLHDVHYASDFAAVGTAFFLLVESFRLGVRTSRTASLASFLACCGFLVILPALLFGLGPISLSQLLELINTERTATVLAIPAWVPFVGLVPAVAGLYLGNARLAQEVQDGDQADSSAGVSCGTLKP